MTRPKARRARGEGSLRYDEKRGLYVGSISYIDERGVRQRPKVTSRSKAKCVEKLDALKAEHRQGLTSDIPSGRLTVAAYLHQWLEDAVRPSTRPSTHASYAQIVRLYLEPAFGRVTLKELTPQRVQSLLNALSRRGLSPRTVTYTRAVLRRALNQALRWGLVPRNVAVLVEPPRQKRTERRVFTHEEAVVFLDAVRGDRLEALYTVALTLGLRRGEAVGLLWSDVDFEHGLLTITGQLVRVLGRGGLIRENAKTSGSHRVLVLPKSCITALERRREMQHEERLAHGVTWKDTGYVFTTSLGTPFEPRNVNRYFERILQRAGLDHITVHGLRHSAATILQAQGESLFDISKLLGHSSIVITGNLYTQVTDPAKRRMADRMDSIYGQDEHG